MNHVSQALREISAELRDDLGRRDRALLPGDVARILDRVAARIEGHVSHAESLRPSYNPDSYLEHHHAC